MALDTKRLRELVVRGSEASAGRRDLGAVSRRVDESQRFVCPIDTPGDADLLVRSLCLPDVGAGRVRLATSVARRWGHGHLGIPLRRVIATRDDGST